MKWLNKRKPVIVQKVFAFGRITKGRTARICAGGYEFSEGYTHQFAEELVRRACATSDPASRASALMNEYRLASPDVQRAIVIALISRVATKGE